MKPTIQGRIEQYRRERIKRRVLTIIALAVVGSTLFFVYRIMQYRFGTESPSSSQAQDATLSR